MRFDILTLFPAMFHGPLTESILKRAQEAGLLRVGLHDIRDYTTDRHRSADDAPFGGGAGMVMKAEPLARCLEAVLAADAGLDAPPAGATQADPQAEREAPPAEQGAPALEAMADSPAGAEEAKDEPRRPDGAEEQPEGAARTPVVLLTPAGRRFDQAQARAWARLPRLVLICGHYEGVDERFIQRYVTDELSIGDFVLTGGELAAMVVVDAVGRLVPGVLDGASLGEESHDGGLLEYPHYTRPASWRGQEIPPVLTSGHHAQVARWRHEQRLLRTLQRRPDLLRGVELPERDRDFLAGHGWQEPGKRRTDKVPRVTNTMILQFFQQALVKPLEFFQQWLLEGEDAQDPRLSAVEAEMNTIAAAVGGMLLAAEHYQDWVLHDLLDSLDYAMAEAGRGAPGKGLAELQLLAKKLSALE